MQPYFFPYIGYWQLISAVDRFVVYDDVNYIKGGWVNRNRILINGNPIYITAPLFQSSPFKRICDTSLQSSVFWRDKLSKTVENTYRNAPFFFEIFPVIKKLISNETNDLSEYLVHQLQILSSFMEIDTEFVVTSRGYGNNDLKGEERVLDICKRENATTYLNAQGGQTLYAVETFRNAGIDLNFIVMNPLPYKQRGGGFVPYLSIIDALMEVGLEGIRYHLQSFELKNA